MHRVEQTKVEQLLRLAWQSSMNAKRKQAVVLTLHALLNKDFVTDNELVMYETLQQQLEDESNEQHRYREQQRAS